LWKLSLLNNFQIEDQNTEAFLMGRVYVGLTP